ncbi:MAG: SDR family oxidoreductase [Coriobacteriales bacterium]|jgi:gluconate 5-dehydrogenase|nr:SDR family oxidoreductase [Coriobacteriales bacterium]
MFELNGKIAMVTGASSGLGIQLAKALARQGADLAIVARRMDKLEQTRQEIEALGVRCFSARCDVTDVNSIREAVAAVKQRYGRIDILVNNAGVARVAPAERQSDEDWLTVLDTNLTGVYYMSREVGKLMIEQDYGKIVNLASIHSNVAMPGLPISGYAATKGGVRMLTRDLANEWAKYHITVNAIGPAYFETDMTREIAHNEDFLEAVKTYCPMGRLGRPGELDGALVYFASDASSFTTGQLLQVDGGWTAI